MELFQRLGLVDLQDGHGMERGGGAACSSAQMYRDGTFHLGHIDIAPSHPTIEGSKGDGTSLMGTQRKRGIPGLTELLILPGNTAPGPGAAWSRAQTRDLQGSIERPVFIDLTHDEEAGTSSASIDLTASEEEVGSSRAVPDLSLLIERSCDLTTGGDAGSVVPEPSLFIERSCGSGDDVSNWTDTPLNVWEHSSWSSKREERSPIRRQQTPLAEQEDIADDERSSSARGRQTPFALQAQNTVSLDQLNAILRESNIPLHESVDRLWGSVDEIHMILMRLYAFIEGVNHSDEALENSFNRLLESSNEQMRERPLIVELLCAINAVLFSR
ncbi:uncharacterized protein LOC130550351 [Triplophysa rosa]|uniref:uncharacterized protein LOC130550351 n=1 Tax=Triplophysa rosa TaxID=992332 RepID=UPI002545F4FC|nr:uncharacterized protein LOC130550351 [Triplophysa rosa]